MNVLDYKGQDNILVVENFCNQRYLDLFLNFVKNTELWEENGDGIWNNRSINLHTMPDDIRESVLDYRIEVKLKIIDFFKLDTDLYADIFQFVRWQKGDQLYPPHADAEYPDGGKHPFWYRNFAAMTYLNDNFEGGELYFTKFPDYPLKIKTGSLVIFPGTMEYEHGVTEVTSGTRFTIASFFTMLPWKKDGYRI